VYDIYWKETPMVRFLVEHAPESVLVARTSDGAYPLHLALEHGASLEVTELLSHHQDPVAAMLRNHAGETPLHVAWRRGASLTVVQSLVNR
jgi:ankyrin repeat protein